MRVKRDVTDPGGVEEFLRTAGRWRWSRWRRMWGLKAHVVPRGCKLVYWDQQTKHRQWQEATCWRPPRREWWIRKVMPDPVVDGMRPHDVLTVLLESSVDCLRVGAGREVRLGEVKEADR